MLTIKLPNEFRMEKEVGWIFSKKSEFFVKNIQSFLTQIPEQLPSEDILLDAQDLNWIEPIGFALLKSFVERCRNNGKKVEWVPTRNKEINSFLKRMGFFGNESKVVKDNYCPLICVHESNINETVDHLKTILAKQMDLDESLLKMFDFSVSELLQNIFHHSEKDYGYIAAMTFPKKRRLQFAIVDNGIGIRQSLLKNPRLNSSLVSDESALALSIQAKFTSNEPEYPLRTEGNAGEGLFWAVEFIKANQGQLYLHSGHGQLVVDKGSVQYVSNGFWQGTIVCLQFDLDKPIDTKAIFDRYAPEDNDFDFLKFDI